MNIISTTSPISIDHLKDFFSNKDDTAFLIDYQNSKLKGSKLLTYLSNIDVPCDIHISHTDQGFSDFVSDYLNSSFIVNISSLEQVVIQILLRAKGLTENNLYDKIIDDNKDILHKWMDILDSLPLYNMLTVNVDEFKELIASAKIPAIDESLSGINFVSILKHEEFYMYYANWTVDQSSHYQDLFNDYMFKGKNLFSYWANSNNPLFLLTFGICEDISDEIKATVATQQHQYDH